MFNTIIVGVDGSEPSHNALRIACDLAGKYGSALHLVHTPQPQTVAFALGAVSGYHAVTVMPDPEEVEKARKKVVSDAEAIVADCGQTLTAVHSEAGDPAVHIVSCAKEVGADLIVTGRRGLGAFGALVQGSTTQSVNHSAECATLSVL